MDGWSVGTRNSDGIPRAVRLEIETGENWTAAEAIQLSSDEARRLANDLHEAAARIENAPGVRIAA